MNQRTVSLGECKFEILTDGPRFVGLGAAWIGDVKVRSGRLPLQPATQSFSGMELAELRLADVREGKAEVRVRTRTVFRPLPVKLMRDHSFDPIHDTGDWDRPALVEDGELDLVLRPATDRFGRWDFRGFSYHYEYRGKSVPLFYILDKASWELAGDIAGATVVSQSSCSAPVCTFGPDTAWTTEGILWFLVEKGADQNPVMTHNLPRWASHQAFDFQFRGDDTLIGVFEKVDLIRSVVMRDAGRPELKTFDKHIFDQALAVSTTPKKVMLNRDRKSPTAQKNCWTWIWQDVDDRARAEYGLREEPMIPFVSQNYWVNFFVDSYFKDLLPAAANIGARMIFVDNLKKSAMTENCPNPGKFTWNMCCGHEYEIAPRLGGVPRVKDFVEKAKALGVRVLSWTNNDQALSSPLNAAERDDKGWFVRLEDARQKYGGAYACVMSVLDMASEPARRYFIDSHVKIKEETGLDGYLFDSFYNLGWMPVSYVNCSPRTMWRGLIQAIKECQDAGIYFTIESFGPWGAPQHGHPSSYNLETIFACINVGVGNDYTTVPTGHVLKDTSPNSVEGVYYALAYMAYRSIPLFVDKKRIDEVWTDAHRRALADYHAALPYMRRRYIQEDDKGLIWHDEAKTRATLFNFAARKVALPGQVHDLTAGRDLPKSAAYDLLPCHTYVVTGCELPERV